MCTSVRPRPVTHALALAAAFSPCGTPVDGMCRKCRQTPISIIPLSPHYLYHPQSAPLIASWRLQKVSANPYFYHTSFPPLFFAPPNHVYAHELERAAYCTATQPHRWPSACAFETLLRDVGWIPPLQKAGQNDMRLATPACSMAPERSRMDVRILRPPP